MVRLLPYVIAVVVVVDSVDGVVVDGVDGVVAAAVVVFVAVVVVIAIGVFVAVVVIAVDVVVVHMKNHSDHDDVPPYHPTAVTPASCGSQRAGGFR